MSVQYPGYATPRLDLAEAYMELEPDASLYIAEEVLPVFDTPIRGGKFPKRKKASLAQIVKTRRAAKGGFERIDSRMGDQSFECETHGLEGVVDDEERALYASEFDADLACVQDIHESLSIAKEIRAATAVFNTTTWTGSSLYTDVSATNPFDTPNSDVITVLLNAREKVRQLGHQADALIIGAAQFKNLLLNTGIRAQFPGAAVITVEMIQRMLGSIVGLPRVLVGGARYDATGEDPTGLATPSLTDIWSDDYCMVAKLAPKGSRISAPGIGRTMRWTKLDMGRRVIQYREEQVAGDVFRELECVDELTIDADCGHLLKID